MVLMYVVETVYVCFQYGSDPRAPFYAILDVVPLAVMHHYTAWRVGCSLVLLDHGVE